MIQLRAKVSLVHWLELLVPRSTRIGLPIMYGAFRLVQAPYIPSDESVEMWR